MEETLDLSSDRILNEYKIFTKLHISCTHRKKELPEDGEELRPKHVEATINKQKQCAESWC